MTGSTPPGTSPRPSFSRWFNLVLAAADGLMASPVRLLVSAGAVASVVFLMIGGLALSEGLNRQARAALRGAADLFVAADAFGADAPLPRERAAPLRTVPGVTAVVERIVGRAQVADDWIVVVGIDAEHMSEVPAERSSVLPAPGEVRIGASLAARLGWRTGKQILLEAQRTLVLSVANTFPEGAGIGSTNAVVMCLEDAATLFDRPGEVSDLLVYCRPGYADRVARTIAQDPQLRVQTAGLVASYIDQAYTIRSGALMLLFGFALAVAAPLFLLIADFGASPRRREIAILKACGWTTGDVLALCLLENLLIALAGAALGILLSFLWVGVLGAPILRAWFVSESLGTAGQLDLPAVFLGPPVLIGVILAVVLTSSAGVLSVWRSSIVPPASAMRV